MTGSRLMHTARQAARPLARAVRRHVLPRVLPPSRHSFPHAASNLRVVGLLSSASGLGESARLCFEALEGTGWHLSTANVARLFASDDHVAFDARPPEPGPDVTIYHLNPPMLLPSILRTGLRRHARTYNIGYWAWELESLPAEWIAAIRFVDAILVPSRFCQTALQAYTDKPVLVVPHPVAAAAAPSPSSRAERSGRFRVVSILNFGSSFARKNPPALVQAFREAFGDDERAELILKVSDGDRYPHERRGLLALIHDAPNVHLIDEVWPRERLDALLGSADAYLSLHRSEGFGLTLAEAIRAGVPVVATNWSGNTDFCDPELCYPVAFDLVPFEDGHLAYAGMGPARWAEPRVAHAAEQLRRVRAAPDVARFKAAALRAALAAYLASHTYVGALASLERAAGGRRDLSQRRPASGAALPTNREG